MRTGIFVYQATTLSIQSSEQLQITSLDGTTDKPVPATGIVAVPIGVYKVLSASPVTVVPGDNIQVIAMPNDKDPWPGLAAETMAQLNVQASQLQAFFIVPDAKHMAI